MIKTSQGGSVLSFVVIGAALVLLLVGGTYFVRQNLSVSSDNRGRNTDTTPKPSGQTDTTKEPTKSDEPAKKPEAVQPAKPTTPTPTAPQQNTAVTPPASLPQTGSVETLGAGYSCCVFDCSSYGLSALATRLCLSLTYLLQKSTIISNVGALY